MDSARPGQRPPAGSDEDELWYAMDRAERELQQHPLLVRDEALNAYVRDVACRVAGDYCTDLRVYIVEQPWFNASMAPNGMMVVWTGALLRFQDEAELAPVLGHEFAHFRERHSLAQWRRAKRSSALLGSFGLLAWGGGAGAAGQLASLLGEASLYQFSREAEREADRLGFAATVAQGYDPAAGARLWGRMVEEEAARTYGKPIPVFASHPKTTERLADVRTAAEASGASTGSTRRDAYRAVVGPFIESWLEDELSRRMYDTSVQVIGRLRGLADAGLQGRYTFTWPKPIAGAARAATRPWPRSCTQKPSPCPTRPPPPSASMAWCCGPRAGATRLRRRCSVIWNCRRRPKTPPSCSTIWTNWRPARDPPPAAMPRRGAHPVRLRGWRRRKTPDRGRHHRFRPDAGDTARLGPHQGRAPGAVDDRRHAP
ncbi:M48 family metallopeptidase [Arenimonas daejeonensis]|uniref:M48 family metallopeptidase n=1 Tax=Arenimonas daejeonensis TaxID=370777 RepID=UPI00131537AF|nr:M48 family metallopeptidase [Arenimonas daejeonensis]